MSFTWFKNAMATSCLFSCQCTLNCTEIMCEMEKDDAEDSLEPIFPNQIFSFKLTWKIYETIKNYPWVTLQFVFCMSFLGVARSLKTLKVLFFVCLFISATYILFFLWYCIRSYPIPFLNPKLLGDVVLAIDPGVDARKWNIVTSKVNDALHDRGH